MTKALLALAAIVMTASPVLAEEIPSPTPGKDLAELAFKSVAGSGQDYIDMGEMEAFRDNVFFSMDINDQNKKLSLEEFMNWGSGMSNLAEEKGRVAAYETALKVVFAFWDRNGDGQISESEHRKAIIADFQRADLNNNAVLSKEEFLNGFSLNVAIRAALKTE